LFFLHCDEPVGAAMDMVYEAPVLKFELWKELVNRNMQNVDISTGCTKRNDVAWNFDHWISYRSGTLGNTGTTIN
jgi:hypothetical protein